MTELEELLAREIDAGSFPGAVALVGTSEAVLEVAAAGRSVVEPEEIPVTPATVYDLASLTKPLASGAVAASLSDLDLSSPPGRYLPEWKATRFDGITLESLLVHTSGLPAWYPVYARGEGAAAYRRTLATIEGETQPGERVIYSDLNFLLFGEVLEVHFSAPLDETFATLVAAPGASAARFLPGRSGSVAAAERGDATERRMAADQGISYPRFREGIVWGDVHDGNAYRRGGVAGNAGLFGAAADVWALARPWLDPARREWTRDRTPHLSEARGLAWQGRRGAGSAVPAMSDRAFGHTGFTGTSVWIDPEADRIAVLLSNRIHPEVRAIDFNAVRKRFHEAVWR
ncbi:MAG: serine hydrolase domain-containing protein [Acidobacteriota bacterium]